SSTIPDETCAPCPCCAGVDDAGAMEAALSVAPRTARAPGVLETNSSSPSIFSLSSLQEDASKVSSKASMSCGLISLICPQFRHPAPTSSSHGQRQSVAAGQVLLQ